VDLVLVVRAATRWLTAEAPQATAIAAPEARVGRVLARDWIWWPLRRRGWRDRLGEVQYRPRTLLDLRGRERAVALREIAHLAAPGGD
jgi:hypothetical protein